MSSKSTFKVCEKLGKTSGKTLEHYCLDVSLSFSKKTEILTSFIHRNTKEGTT